MAEFKNPFTTPQLILIGALIVLFGYLSTSTQLVPNWDNETGTILYSGNDMVPKSNVSIGQAFFGTILVILLVMTFIGKNRQTADIATPEEAQEALNDFLKKRKKVELKDGTVITLGDYYIDTNFLTKSRTDKTGTKMVSYIFQIRIEDGYLTYYFKGDVHPNTRYVTRFIEMDGPLEEKDKCPKCGTEYDEKYMDTEDLKGYKKLKEDLSN